MNKVTKYTLMVVVMAAALWRAGRHVRNEEVIYNMPDNVYQVMPDRTGHLSDNPVANEYVKNKDCLDSMAFDCEYQ